MVNGRLTVLEDQQNSKTWKLATNSKLWATYIYIYVYTVAVLMDFYPFFW